MNSTVIIKSYTEPPFSEKEILRYAGCRGTDEEIVSLMRSCIGEVEGRLSFCVCCRELEIREITQDSHIDFGIFDVTSADLAKNLRGCTSVIVFAATVGMEIDRLIYKYSRLSPSKALMMQAIGAERIEALCDVFCEDIAREKPNFCQKPRFSPGYGDLSIDVQKKIFEILNCTKLLGISLNESLLMSPSKSVTAFVGLGTESEKRGEKCEVCCKNDCIFRSKT